MADYQRPGYAHSRRSSLAVTSACRTERGYAHPSRPAAGHVPVHRHPRRRDIGNRSDATHCPAHTGAHARKSVPFDGIPIMTTLAEIDEQVGILHATRADFVRGLLSRLPATPPNYTQIVTLNERGLLPEQPVTELEAGGNRCAVS